MMEKVIKKIQLISENENTGVFIVGGYLRDFLLNRKSFDMDICVSKSAQNFAKKLAKITDGKFIILDSENENYRVALLKDECLKYIDVSGMKGKNINDDLKKRDFTINALAVSINHFCDIKNNLIDLFKGYDDLKNKTVNAVSEVVFKQDPIRMLRCFRIASELNFTISKKTLSLIKKNAIFIKKAVPEMIKNEFFRVLSSKNSAKYIEMIDEAGLLENIFPVIKEMKKSARKFYYHPKGLFQHTMLTLDSLEKILNDTQKYFQSSNGELLKHLDVNYSENVNKKNLLKFIALFHDCAKPDCAKKVDGKLRFLDHENIGAAKIESIMKNLKMSKKEIQYAKNIVASHMRPSNLLKSGTATERAKLRLFRDIAENIPDLLIMALADWHSYKNLKVYSKKILKMQQNKVSKFIDDYFEISRKKPEIKIINGNILMKKLSLKPGKIVGALLKLINERHEKKLISTEKQALSFAKLKLTALRKIYKI
jgi:poly(A) polymerase